MSFARSDVKRSPPLADYSGSVAAQIAYAGDARWRMPSTHYVLAVPEADLSIVFIDTPRACPSYMTAPYGDCNELCAEQLAAVGCTAATATACFESHLAWLNATLAGLTTRWKFVAGHHPIDAENMHLAAASFAAHGVQAYLAGHVHNLQHAASADGVQYFISGAGAFVSAAAAAAAGEASDRLPSGVLLGSSHTARRIAVPGAVSGWVGDGPGWLQLSVDNDAPTPTTTARFVNANGTVMFTTAFSA